MEPKNQGTIEPGYSYRNLALWQDAQDFAREVVELINAVPSTRTVEIIARQLVRSSTSIAANIAEGHGRFSPAAYRHHLSIAKGSACETDSWIDLLLRLDLISADREAELHRRCASLIGGLTRRIKELERLAGKVIRDGDVEYEPMDEAAAGSKVPWFDGSRELPPGGSP